MIEIRITIEGTDEEKRILFNSILQESIDSKVIKVNKEKSEIIIRPQSISRGRAIMNSYISWIYTIMETIKRVKQ
mgnify:CR=1 FL=1